MIIIIEENRKIADIRFVLCFFLVEEASVQGRISGEGVLVEATNIERKADYIISGTLLTHFESHTFISPLPVVIIFSKYSKDLQMFATHLNLT